MAAFDKVFDIVKGVRFDGHAYRNRLNLRSVAEAKTELEQLLKDAHKEKEMFKYEDGENIQAAMCGIDKEEGEVDKHKIVIWDETCDEVEYFLINNEAADRVRFINEAGLTNWDDLEPALYPEG